MMHAKTIGKSLIWMTFFSVSMGYLEASVVVYLREIAYPDGFGFPLVPLDTSLSVTEILREAATIIMLLAAGYLGGRYRGERFAWFLYCFAVWDIFYYVFLKLLLGWPPSLMTWDVLFLIPVVWTGPVIAPVIVSVTMILLAAIILNFSGKQTEKIRIHWQEWLLFIVGSAVVILSFIWDYCSFVLTVLKESGLSYKAHLSQMMYNYVPLKFNWLLFIAGLTIILAGIHIFFRRYRKNEKRRVKKEE